MPKAGTAEYPSRDLDDCAGYLRRARDMIKTRAMTREGFAQAIGHSVRGGGFGKLIGAMASYGLVETGKGRITTTDLGEQILYGDQEEMRKGKEKAVRNVHLFDEIYQRFGGSVSDDQLRVFLRERAGVGVATVSSVAGEIGRLLRKNSALVTTGFGTKTRAKDSSATAEVGELVGKLETADYGILNIRDEISMDLAISLLTQVKKAKGWPSPTSRGAKNRPPASRRNNGKDKRPSAPAKQM